MQLAITTVWRPIKNFLCNEAIHNDTHTSRIWLLPNVHTHKLFLFLVGLAMQDWTSCCSIILWLFYNFLLFLRHALLHPTVMTLTNKNKPDSTKLLNWGYCKMSFCLTFFKKQNNVLAHWSGCSIQQLATFQNHFSGQYHSMKCEIIILSLLKYSSFLILESVVLNDYTNHEDHARHCFDTTFLTTPPTWHDALDY